MVAMVTTMAIPMRMGRYWCGEMRVEIKDGTLRDICFIAANLRSADREEIYATAAFTSGTDVGAGTFLGSDPDLRWTAWLDGRPVGAFGFSAHNPYQPNLRSGWAFGTDKFKRVAPAITRFSKVEVPKRLIPQGVTRVEIRSLDGHDLAHKWLSGINAHHEGIMKNYGINGETFHLWSWLKEDWE